MEYYYRIDIFAIGLIDEKLFKFNLALGALELLNFTRNKVGLASFKGGDK